MSKKWSVGESGSVDDFLQSKGEDIQVGDTIQYVSNNQMGWKKYKVVIGDDGKKGLKLIADYDSMIDEYNDDTKSGGKRRRRRKTIRKTKRTKKTRRKRKTRR
jgi:hypothetical protein